MNRRNFIKRGSLFVPAIFIPRLIRAQTPLTSSGLAGFIAAATGGGGGGGGGGTWTYLGGVSVAGTSGTTTTGALDTTGATDLFALATQGGGTHPTLSDSKGNTWVANIDWTKNHYSLFHSAASSVGTGHTVTSANVSGCSVVFFAFQRSSGSATFVGATTPSTTPSTGATGNWSSNGTVHTGSLTPGGANDLMIAVAWWDVGAGGAGDTVDSSFVKIGSIGTNPGAGAAYKIKVADSSAENPGWVHVGAADGFLAVADYS